jgi:hypothetical protein
VQERAAHVVFRVIQTGALQGLPHRVVGALRAAVGVAPVHRNDASTLDVDHHQVDLSFFIDDGTTAKDRFGPDRT